MKKVIIDINNKTIPKRIFPEKFAPNKSKLVSEAFKKTPITVTIIANNPINKMLPERPSLYITKIKEIKTNIVPGSGWRTIKKAGKDKRVTTLNLVLKSWNLTLTELKYLANAKEHESFAISEGWIEKEPNWNQDFAPLIAGMNKTPINNNKTII